MVINPQAGEYDAYGTILGRDEAKILIVPLHLDAKCLSFLMSTRDKRTRPDRFYAATNYNPVTVIASAVWRKLVRTSTKPLDHSNSKS